MEICDTCGSVGGTHKLSCPIERTVEALQRMREALERMAHLSDTPIYDSVARDFLSPGLRSLPQPRTSSQLP